MQAREGLLGHAIAALGRKLLPRDISGGLTLTLPSGKVHRIGYMKPGASCDLQLKTFRPIWSAVRRGAIGFAESYMAGDVESSDITAVLRFYLQNREPLDKAARPVFHKSMVDRLFHLRRANTKAGARRNISAHYDLGNEFYAVWLDQTMSYSSAFFGQEGESLKSGLQNLLADMQRGKITMTDENAFEVGKNVATTEGAVVYETQLMQLIQYKPLTAKVYARPFLFVPPAINKFYILDLQPENSMIRFAIEQGHTVFVLSWKNPQQSESAITWDDYLELGPIAAIHAVQEITGAKDLNVLGFCVGGTILTAALAVLHARGEKPAASLTLMTALLDFEDTGVLDVFIDESHVRMREKSLGKGGLMSGRDLNNTFSSLRPNDLVWNYVVSNYLEGKQPPAFDLLYWNGDSTNLPGPMYAWYLRNCYLENNLRVPNKVKSCGVSLNIGLVNVPAYVFSAKEDHIVPWKAGYASARVLPGTDGKGKDVRYVLGASGHIAGSINPASKNKRCYWAQPVAAKPVGLPADSEAWLAGADEVPGSWWSDWSTWLAQFGGPMKPAPKGYGNSRYKVIEPAPGRYVKEKA
jgi:polyhydroxyalkanoate synthase